jgi:hypothetical protein
VRTRTSFFDFPSRKQKDSHGTTSSRSEGYGLPKVGNRHASGGLWDGNEGDPGAGFKGRLMGKGSLGTQGLLKGAVHPLEPHDPGAKQIALEVARHSEVQRAPGVLKETNQMP